MRRGRSTPLHVRVEVGVQRRRCLPKVNKRGVEREAVLGRLFVWVVLTPHGKSGVCSLAAGLAACTPHGEQFYDTGL